MKRVKSGIANALVEVNDITELVEICEQLDIGDLVVENNNGTKTLYRVSKRDESGLSLTYTDSSNVIEIAYNRDENGAWSYDKTTETELGASGTKLYQHLITLTGWTDSGGTQALKIVSLNPTPYTSLANILKDKNDLNVWVGRMYGSTFAQSYDKFCFNGATYLGFVAQKYIFIKEIGPQNVKVYDCTADTLSIVDNNVVVENHRTEKGSFSYISDTVSPL